MVEMRTQVVDCLTDRRRGSRWTSSRGYGCWRRVVSAFLDNNPSACVGASFIFDLEDDPLFFFFFLLVGVTSAVANVSDTTVCVVDILKLCSTNFAKTSCLSFTTSSNIISEPNHWLADDAASRIIGGNGTRLGARNLIRSKFSTAPKRGSEIWAIRTCRSYIVQRYQRT